MTSCALFIIISFAKAELARKQAEYNARLKDQARDIQKTSTEGIQVLADLPLVPYLDDGGRINDPRADAKVRLIPKRNKYCVGSTKRKSAPSFRSRLVSMQYMTKKVLYNTLESLAM